MAFRAQRAAAIARILSGVVREAFVRRWWVRVLLAGTLALVGVAVGLAVVLRPPAPLSLPEPGAVLDGVTLVRPGAGREADRRIVVRGETIESIGPASGGGGPYAGLYVMPGLADLHVHFPPSSLAGQGELFAFLLLAHGVTAVRDAGDVDGTASEPVRRGIAEGRFAGPRISACGMFVDGEPPLWKNTLLARSPDEGRAAVATLAERGWDCVKAYNRLDAPTLAAIRDAAHARGLPVIGHVPRRVSFEEARLDDVQHLTGVPEPSDPALEFPELLRDFEGLDEARLERVIEVSLRHGIAHTPTLVTIDRLIQSERLAALLEAPELRLLPRFYREVVWSPEGGTSVAGRLDAAGFAMVRRAFEVMKRCVRRMGERGVRLHTGTDTLIAFVVPGASLHRELRLWVEAGFSPEQALAASRDSAADLGVARLGELAPGAPADLVILRSDPTQSLAALDEIEGVVRGGRLYTREWLDAQLARYRAHYDGALYDAVVTPLVRRVLAATRRR